MTPEIAAREVQAARDNGTYQVTWSSNKSQPRDRNEIREHILRVLSHGEAITDHIRRRVGCSKTGIYTNLSALEAEGKIKSRKQVIKGNAHHAWSLT